LAKYSSPTQIVTIGGGTGAPAILRALVLAGFSHISAISTSMDSGGKTGIIRSDERDRVIAVSDLLRNLLALISPSQAVLPQVTAFTNLLAFTDGRNRNLGYTLYYALLEKYGNNFLSVQHHLEQLLGIRFKGTAIPVSIEPANICFSTRLGTDFCGEHELDRQSMSTNTITKIWLDHAIPASPEALEAIKTARFFIYCPGSIYGSVLSNLLPAGITAALKQSRATKILVTNLVSNRNQTHQFTALDYYKLFARYTRLAKPFDVVIVPHLSQTEFESKYPHVTADYASEHSHFHGWTEKQLASLEKQGVMTVRAPIFSITPKLNRIRHDPGALAKVFRKIMK
jgi:uncharacterized cofD-like protein